MKEEMLRDSRKELNQQIHSTLNDWTFFLGSEDLLEHLNPHNLRKPIQPLSKLPVPAPLQPFNLHLDHVRAIIVNQLNFQLSIREHMNQGQLFSQEQIKAHAPKYQDTIEMFKQKHKPNLEILDRDELEQNGILQDMEILKRYITQERFNLDQIKHRLEQRKLNKLLQ